MYQVIKNGRKTGLLFDVDEQFVERFLGICHENKATVIVVNAYISSYIDLYFEKDMEYFEGYMGYNQKYKE